MAEYLGGRIEPRLRRADGSAAVMEMVNDGAQALTAGTGIRISFRPDDAWVIGAPASSAESFNAPGARGPDEPARVRQEVPT